MPASQLFVSNQTADGQIRINARNVNRLAWEQTTGSGWHYNFMIAIINIKRNGRAETGRTQADDAMRFGVGFSATHIRAHITYG